jgi:hypothetical protein
MGKFPRTENVGLERGRGRIRAVDHPQGSRLVVCRRCADWRGWGLLDFTKGIVGRDAATRSKDGLGTPIDVADYTRSCVRWRDARFSPRWVPIALRCATRVDLLLRTPDSGQRPGQSRTPRSSLLQGAIRSLHVRVGPKFLDCVARAEARFIVPLRRLSWVGSRIARESR